jgi:DNA primase
MPKSSFIDYDAVKAAITMEQVLDHYGLLERFKRSGCKLSGPCPFHKNSNPTQFNVNIRKNVWNCLGECKHGGGVLDFIAIKDNLSIHAAAVKAIKSFKLEPDTMAAESGLSPEIAEI